MYNNCYSNILKIIKENYKRINIQLISNPVYKFELRTHNNIIMYNNFYNNILKKNIILTNYIKYLIANAF